MCWDLIIDFLGIREYCTLELYLIIIIFFITFPVLILGVLGSATE